MCYVFLIAAYYLMLFCPSLIVMPFSLILALPFFLFSRTRKASLLALTLLLTISMILDHTALDISIEKENVTTIGVKAIEDGAVKKGGMYGFPAVLRYVYDGYGVYASASGEVYVYSNKEEVRAGDSLRCTGLFTSSSLFIAESVITVNTSPFRDLRKSAEAILRKRLSALEEEERNLALMLLLAMTDDGESLVTELGRKKGVSHVFALSGMHLSLIASFLLPPLSFLMGKKRGEYVLLVFLFLFTFLSGFRASLLRALLFRILITLFPSSEEGDVFLLTFLLHAAFFPESLMRAGAVFSYLSVAGMFLLSSRLETLSERMFHFRLSFLFVSISCLIFTIPYSFHLFGSFTFAGIIYSPLVNFLVTLYMGLLFISLIIPLPSHLFSVLYLFLEKTLSFPLVSVTYDNLKPYYMLLVIVFIPVMIKIVSIPWKKCKNVEVLREKRL